MESYKEMRSRLVAEMVRVNGENRSMLDTLSKESRDFTGEELGAFTKRNEALDELEQRVKAIDKTNESSASIEQMSDRVERGLRPQGDPREQTPEDELEQRAIEFFTGKSLGDGEINEGGVRKAVLEVPFRGLRIHRDSRGRNVVVETRSERRTGLNTLSATAGDDLVPVGFRAVLYQHLVFNSAIRQTRATQLTTNSGEPIQLPKTTAHPADGTIVAQGAVINENDPTFGQGTLNAYKFGNLIQISTELEQDTAVDLLGYIAMATGRALANGSGKKFILGTGTNEPQGILVGSGTIAQVIGGTGQAGVPTYKELESIFDAIIPPYQMNGEWILNQVTVSKLRQLTDLYGRPLWLPSLTSEMPSQLFGKPYYLDPYVPSAGTSATSIAFGDFASYFIRDVQGIRFERSVEFAFNQDLVTYRALLRTDGQLLDLTGAIANYRGGTV